MGDTSRTPDRATRDTPDCAALHPGLHYCPPLRGSIDGVRPPSPRGSEDPMSHSFSHFVYHIVYATKERRPCIDEAVQPELYSFLAELVRAEGGVSFAVN